MFCFKVCLDVDMTYGITSDLLVGEFSEVGHKHETVSSKAELGGVYSVLSHRGQI